MPREQIFLLENEVTYAGMMRDRLLMESSFELHEFSCGKEMLRHLPAQPLCVILSTAAPDITTEELIRRIRDYNPQTEVVLSLKPAELEHLPDFLRLDIAEVLVKDTQLKYYIWLLIKRLNRIRRDRESRARLNELVFTEQPGDYQVLPAGTADRKTRSFIHRATRNKTPVLLYSHPGGEPEQLALQIHKQSAQVSGPFVSVNLRLHPKEKHRRLLTGGSMERSDEQGWIRQAIGGTLFLAHVELLSTDLLQYLLQCTSSGPRRAIEGTSESDGFRLIVSTDHKPADFRSSPRIDAEIAELLCRQAFRIIPLREKSEEISEIAQAFIEEYCRQSSLPLKSLSPDAILKLKNHPFPDDKRELRQLMQHAIELTNEPIIQASHLRFPDPAFNLGLDDVQASGHSYKIQRVAYYLKVFDDDVQQVARHLGIGKSTIYRYRDQGLINFGK